MKKCEWKDGIFYPCEFASEEVFSENKTIMGNILELSHIWNYCPSCGGDITRSEPIIEKSGGTWVARHERINYLWVGVSGVKKTNHFFDHKGYIMTNVWKPFSEIKITDEIAKLRPKVVVLEDLEILYGVCSKAIYTTKSTTHLSSADVVRLATVDDLD